MFGAECFFELIHGEMSDVTVYLIPQLGHKARERLQSKNRTKEDERTSNSKFPFSTGVCCTEIQRNDWRKGLTPDVSF